MAQGLLIRSVTLKITIFFCDLPFGIFVRVIPKLYEMFFVLRVFSDKIRFYRRNIYKTPVQQHPKQHLCTTQVVPIATSHTATASTAIAAKSFKAATFKATTHLTAESEHGFH